MGREQYKEMMNEVSPTPFLIAQTKLAASSAAQSSPQGGNTMKRSIRRIALGAATLAAAFAVCVNVSPALAADLDRVPILGSIARVLCVRDITEQYNDKTIEIHQPAVDETALPATVDVNKAIADAIAQYNADADRRIAEYKDAFFATGGTQEEYDAKNIGVLVDYAIKCDNDKYISFILYMNENWSSANDITQCYNLDAVTGEALTLEALLGPDYISLANRQINEQISADSSGLFFDKEHGGFESITADSKFYINEEGNVVIFFDKYTIAAGAAGSPEFVIVP